MPRPPWNQPVGVDAIIEKWTSSGAIRECLTADRVLAGSRAGYAPIPEELGTGLRRALAERGVSELYTHQALAFAEARRPRHVVIATPTASGKSLCFHLPVLTALEKDPQGRALYLYPTKALSRDQETNLGELIADAGLAASRIVYDGDTPGDARRAARERSAIIMTNPDMLSAGILPHHAQWARLFQALKYVVIDEMHTYRGVFGSHMAHVIARLKRVATFHGSRPTFLCATATIGNPRAHGARLLGIAEDELSLVERSGAPSGNRRFFLYNPPVVNAELGIRASYLKSAVRLTSDLIDARVPTILFGQSRNSVEIMLKYLRDRCAARVGEAAIMGYRGGYLPETRRRIERGLRNGEILCVVATNALELGIDIGVLEAAVCAGYPGSVASTWQRFGRAGRRGGTSLAVLVSSSAPLDQYLARTPQFLLDGNIEEARIDPSNVEIAVQHLKCAAFELPFVMGKDAEGYACLSPEETVDALRFLASHHVVHEVDDRFHWSADSYPANHVSLRNIGWDNFVIIDRAMGKTLAELDWRAAHTMLHEQAIYQHDAEQYQVEHLDYENRKAFVTKVLPDYFTEAMVNQKVTILEQSAQHPIGRATVGWGEVSVIEKIVGFKKIKFHTHENAGYGEVRLPDMQMHTTSFWLTLPESLCIELGRARAVDGLRGVGRALETLATLALMCEPRDIGRAIEDKSPELDASSVFFPTLFLFDHFPGGVGLAERIFENAPDLLARTAQLLSRCPCEDGCPMCVGPTEMTEAIRKSSALRILQAFLEGSRGLEHQALPSLAPNSDGPYPSGSFE